MARVLSLSLLLVAFVATASLSSASVIETNSLAVRQDGRDESFPACDNEDGSIPDGAPQQSTLTAWDTHPSADQIGHHHYWSGHDHGHEHDHHHHHNGDVQPYRTSDDPVFYVAPGLGSCEFNYTDADPGVCLAPGWLRSAHINGCNKWVEVELPAFGTKAYARVLDACGAVQNTTFGCNDAYLTLSTFSALVQGNTTIIKAGRTPGPIRWRFTQEPCFGCWEGLPGKLPAGGEDSCTGPDASGFIRSGRKTGADIVNATDAGLQCAASYSGGPLTAQASVAGGNKKPNAAAPNAAKAAAANPTAAVNVKEFKQQFISALNANEKQGSGGQVDKRDSAHRGGWHQGRAHVWSG